MQENMVLSFVKVLKTIFGPGGKLAMLHSPAEQSPHFGLMKEHVSLSNPCKQPQQTGMPLKANNFGIFSVIKLLFVAFTRQING